MCRSQFLLFPMYVVGTLNAEAIDLSTYWEHFIHSHHPNIRMGLMTIHFLYCFQNVIQSQSRFWILFCSSFTTHFNRTWWLLLSALFNRQESFLWSSLLDPGMALADAYEAGTCPTCKHPTKTRAKSIGRMKRSPDFWDRGDAEHSELNIQNEGFADEQYLYAPITVQCIPM